MKKIIVLMFLRGQKFFLPGPKIPQDGSVFNVELFKWEKTGNWLLKSELEGFQWIF